MELPYVGEITLLAGSDFFDSAGECNLGSVTSPFLSNLGLAHAPCALARHAIEIDSVSPSSRGEMSTDLSLNGETSLGLDSVYLFLFVVWKKWVECSPIKMTMKSPRT